MTEVTFFFLSMEYSNHSKLAELDRQRVEFAGLAPRYDQIHTLRDEHGLALSWLCGACDHFGFESLLEVGAGTGRFIPELHRRCPGLSYTGIEPVEELRAQGYARGVPRDRLINGTGYDLPFDDGAFDVVFECAVLHHVKRPALVIAEMLRVARQAIFISDNNTFGQGGVSKRLAKHLIRACGLWGLARYLNTGGRGHLEYGDGVSYTYSVFDNLPQIRRSCDQIYVMNTDSLSGYGPFWSAPHVALLALKTKFA